jgi:hypothetical protein
MKRQDRIRILFEEAARRRKINEQEDRQVKDDVLTALELTLEELTK